MAYSDGLVLCEQMVGTTPSQLDLTQKQLLFSDGFRMFFQFRKLLSLWIFETFVEKNTDPQNKEGLLS